MRQFLVLILAWPAEAVAESYADYGQTQQCGSYEEATYDRQSWFPGGEGGVITLIDPQPVRGLNALLFDGIISEEGFSDPAGRVLAMRGPFVSATGLQAEEVVVIVTDQGIRLLQRCP